MITTAEEFKKLDSRTRWKIAQEINGFVTWHCECCEAIVDDGVMPRRVMDGSVHCGNCNAVLTERTGGGQFDPFNFTFRVGGLKPESLENRVVIQDLTARNQGVPERTLADNSQIRFEIKGVHFIVAIDPVRECLVVQKKPKDFNLDTIVINPIHQNAILLK